MDEEGINGAAHPSDPRFYTETITGGNRGIGNELTSKFTVPRRYTNLQYLSAGAQGTVV